MINIKAYGSWIFRGVGWRMRYDTTSFVHLLQMMLSDINSKVQTKNEEEYYS